MRQVASRSAINQDWTLNRHPTDSAALKNIRFS